MMGRITLDPLLAKNPFVWLRGSDFICTNPKKSAKTNYSSSSYGHSD